MNRFVLKINDSTYVKDIQWIVMEIPTITTDSFENAVLIREDYLNQTVIPDGTNNGLGVSRKQLLLKYFPQLKIIPVKVVLDE